MRQGINKGSPPGGEWFIRGGGAVFLASLSTVLLIGGCKACPTELRGKTSFGPEWRNRGNNTSEIRYDARQALEVKWDNGWSTGVHYRRRDVDNGSGDSENRVLVEVGYPLWKAPKKEDKATDKRIQQLQEQVEEMRATVAALKPPVSVEEARVAQVPGAGN